MKRKMCFKISRRRFRIIKETAKNSPTVVIEIIKHGNQIIIIVEPKKCLRIKYYRKLIKEAGTKVFQLNKNPNYHVKF